MRYGHKIMKIAFFQVENWEKEVILKALPNHNLFFSEKRVDEDNLPERNDFEIISGFTHSRITGKVADYFPGLKLVATRSTGFDHIDIEACKARGVAVVSVPGYGSHTVAEFTFGLILNLTRKIYRAIDQIKETGSFSLAELRGIDIYGKTLGVLGTGKIGKEVIKIAKGFGMGVVAYDIFKNEPFAKEYGITYLDLPELLGKSDIITIHCLYNPSTRHLINKKNIGQIKKGAYLINTARGEIVETAALIQGLEDGIIAGAGLDVLEEEVKTKDELEFLKGEKTEKETLKTILENRVLMNKPNVLVTPHSAFNSWEAMTRILETTIKNIKSFIDEKPENLVS